MPITKIFFSLLLSVCYNSLTCVLCHASVVNNSSNNPRPVAYIHPGPGKTGTTHLQGFLVASEKTLLDNNLAMWPDLYPAFQQCKEDGSLKPTDAMYSNRRDKQLKFYSDYYKRCRPMQSVIRQFIQDSFKLNRNLIFSSESFDTKSILEMLREANYQIHGIIVYRFPLSWFISRYKETIKTSSITSKEYKPHTQLSTLTFTEYARSKWKHYFGDLHSVDMFFRSLTPYPGHGFSIIDLYGGAAANKDLKYMVFCEVMGILCESSIFEEMKTLQAHDSETDAVVMERQMAFHFVRFAATASQNCSLDFSKTKGRARHFLQNRVMNNWKVKIPQRPASNISQYVKQSLEMDTKLRNKYEQYFIHGNATANALKAKPVPSVMEVDSYVVDSKQEWRREMHDFVLLAKKMGVC